MKIGVLSDTHNNVANLQAALQVFRSAAVETLIHCGDLSRPGLAELLAEFRVIYAFGNNDVATGEIQAILQRHNPENWAGAIYTGKLDGKQIAVSHGHLLPETKALLHSGEHDYVFTGHSHRRKDEQIGPTRRISPGALGGLKPEPRSVCTLDLQTGQAEFIQIETG